MCNYARNNFRPAAMVAALATALALLGSAALAGDVEYQGIKSCKKCHSNVVKSWEKTPHGLALDILKPNERADKKSAAGLDPAKDYTTDAACLKCHTTGYGEPGGYAVPDPDDKKSVRQAANLAHVTCEMCHGPGGAYIEHHEKVMKEKLEYTHEEMFAAGLWKVEEKTCLTCHNDQSPTHAQAEPWDWEKKKEKGVHEHEELKQLKK